MPSKTLSNSSQDQTKNLILQAEAAIHMHMPRNMTERRHAKAESDATKDTYNGNIAINFVPGLLGT